MPTLHVVSTKQFQFRGQPERFSNGYNFQTGSNVVDAAFAESVAQAVIDVERAFHSTQVRFVYAVAGLLNEDALWSEELGAAGPTGQLPDAVMHPETVVMAESKLRNRVYLRKYFHTGAHAVGADDTWSVTERQFVNAQILKFTDGTMPGGVQACYPNGDLATEPFGCDPYLRTHQLKRRGRRPTTSG